MPRGLRVPGVSLRAYNMEAYKINYFQKWDTGGTHYDQSVTIAMTPARIAEINAKIGELAFAREFSNRFLLKSGANFVCLSARNVIARECGIDTDRRYKDRNTVFNIIEA